MRKMIIATVAFAVLLPAMPAQAQQYQETWTEQQTTCVASCFEKKQKKQVVKKVTKKGKRPCPPCCVVLRQRVVVLEREYLALANGVGVLKDRADDHDTRIQALEDEIAEIKKAISGNTELVIVLRDSVTRLESRVKTLEAISDPINVGPEVGFLWLSSQDGTKFSALPVGLQIDLRFSEYWKIGADLAMAFSVGDRPVSSVARGFLGFDFPRVVGLELGFSSIWASWNEKVEAKAAFFMGDLAVNFRIVSGMNFSAGLMLGEEFDKNGPEFAGGFNLALRYMF